MQFDGLRAAAVAGRAIAAFNPTDAAAVGAGNVLGAAHKADAFATGAVPDGHALCIQQSRFLRNSLARKNPPRAAIERSTPRGLSTAARSSRKMLKIGAANGRAMTLMMLVVFACFVALAVLSFVAILVADAEGPPRFSLRSLLLALTVAAVAIGLIAALISTYIR
jgi:hypothetical protein